MPTVRLSDGHVVRVDSEDVDLLTRFRWRVASHGYVVRAVRVGRKTFSLMLHNEIMGGGNWIYDHVNRDRLDNRRSNLRKATPRENAANRGKPLIDKSTSKYKGVAWRRKSGRWRAQLQTAGKSFWLGEFRTQEEAALAYNAKARELFGEFAYQNEVPRAIARTIPGA